MDEPATMPIYQVDAFTDRAFCGNPAAVCLFETWLPDATLQAIAAENNLSETAFLVPLGEAWELRWMTPTTEVDLCGHATLAAAWVLFEEVQPERDEVQFDTRSGVLTVTRQGAGAVLDLPSRPARPAVAPPGLARALGAQPQHVLLTDRDILAVFEQEAQVRALRPSMTHLLDLEGRNVIATAPGEDVDFVSRYFAPCLGVPEDPVTGSAHCTLTPYWSARLGRRRLEARQVSARTGALSCEDAGERVRLTGQAVLVLRGELLLPD